MKKYILSTVLTTMFAVQEMFASGKVQKLDASISQVWDFSLASPASCNSSSVSSVSASPVSPRLQFKASGSFVSISHKVSCRVASDTFIQHTISSSPRVKDLLNCIDASKMDDAYLIIKDFYDQKNISCCLIKELNNRGFNWFDPSYLDVVYSLEQLQAIYEKERLNQSMCMSKLKNLMKVIIKKKQDELAQQQEQQKN